MGWGKKSEKEKQDKEGKNKIRVREKRGMRRRRRRLISGRERRMQKSSQDLSLRAANTV